MSKANSKLLQFSRRNLRLNFRTFFSFWVDSRFRSIINAIFDLSYCTIKSGNCLKHLQALIWGTASEDISAIDLFGIKV